MSVPGSAYKLLLSCPSGLSRSQVYADFSASYDRIPHPDTNLEKSIAEIWSQRMQETPSLYNGQKFRYGGYTLKSIVNSGEHSVCLKLGLTEYRTFVGTNLNPLWENFLAPSEDDSIRCQHMASPLGNGAIVETSDKRILVLQRSLNVGEFPGYFVFPGGHSEPMEVGISAHTTDEGLTDSVLLNEKVAEEMFDGIIREVVEEIGVPAPSLEQETTDSRVWIVIRLTGSKNLFPVEEGNPQLEHLFHHKGEPWFNSKIAPWLPEGHRIKTKNSLFVEGELNVRPTAFFFLKCNLESKEVHELYSNAQDGYESTQLYTMSRSDIDSVTLKIPGCHRGGYALYELMAASGDAQNSNH